PHPRGPALYAAPDGAETGRCTEAAPCSLESALSRGPGRIWLLAGEYGDVRIEDATDLAIEAGRDAILDAVEVEDSKRVELRGMSGARTSEPDRVAVFDAKTSEDVTFDDVDLTNGSFWVRGSDGVAIRDATVHDGANLTDARAAHNVPCTCGVYA